jgi:hypothetical protein
MIQRTFPKLFRRTVFTQFWSPRIDGGDEPSDPDRPDDGNTTCPPFRLAQAARSRQRPKSHDLDHRKHRAHFGAPRPADSIWTVQNDSMIAIVGVLLLVWLVVAVLGFVIKGLVWLAIIGLILFVVTAAYGWVKRKASSR